MLTGEANKCNDKERDNEIYDGGCQRVKVEKGRAHESEAGS